MWETSQLEVDFGIALVIYFNLKIHNSWTIANWTHVYVTFLTQNQLWN